MLAKLRHPNVMTVYGLAEHAGRVGMWGELIRGSTLAELVKQQGKFSAAEATSIGKEVCRALAAAHASGLLHRDVKAQNVMREEGGRIVLMDFGLGVFAGSAVPNGPSPSISGTPVYMAPELLLGMRATPQSDIYSVGVLLFFLVTGLYPVEGRSLAHLQEAHERGRRLLLSDVRPDLPDGYTQIVSKAMAQKPEDRFQTVGELLQALSEQTPINSPSRSETNHQVDRRWWMAGLLAALAGAAGIYVFKQPASSSPIGYKASVAVLPLTNLSPPAENEFLADGMGEELVNELAKSEGLRVVARASTLPFSDSRTRNLAQIGNQLKVDTLLTGSVRRSGDRIRVSVQLVRAADGTQLWSEVYEHQLKDVFAVQHQISKAVAGVLQVKLAGAVPGDVNSEAYNLFLQGRFYLNKGNSTNTAKAIEYYNAALKLDPNYARAYAGLARAYSTMTTENLPTPEFVAKARDAANRALQLDGRLSEAHASLAALKGPYDWDWAGADAEFRMALDLNPKNVDARFQYAGLLLNQQRTGEVRVQLQRAEELDPLDPMLPRFKAILLFVEGRNVEAEREIQKVLSTSPDHPAVHASHGVIAFGLGRKEEGLAAFSRAFELAESPGTKSWFGWALGHAGKVEEARRILREMEELARRHEATPVQVAFVASGLGELDLAFRLLDEAVKVHDPALVQARVTPMFAELRKDPRFDRLLMQIGLDRKK